MAFLEEMENTLNEDFNYSVTENGALGYGTTGKALLDMNFAVAGFRNAETEEILTAFRKAWFEDKTLALKWLFFARDCRGGLGERRTFRVCFNELIKLDINTAKAMLKYIPFFGRWDDLVLFIDNKYVASDVYDIIGKQLKTDIKDMEDGKPISLLAKWLPSINTSNKDRVRLAKKLAHSLEMSDATYRKTLAGLRKHLNVTETKMCAGKWGEIDYSAVPSKANLLYRNAFMNHDPDRRADFLRDLMEGDCVKEMIHADVLYPHEIISQYVTHEFWNSGVKSKDATLEALWKALPDMENENTLVVADGSGSMMTPVSGQTSALDVANGIAIYYAEKAKGEFRNKYITFSENPQLVSFEQCDSLRDKIQCALAHDECANTNIRKTFELILQTAINGKMEQEEMPGTILVISDMEFDCATYVWEQDHSRLFDGIKEEFEKAGYKLPRLVFWNVDSRTNTIPVKENELGVALVSGFSLHITKMVMSGKLDAYEVLVETLMGERYKDIEVVK